MATLAALPDEILLEVFECYFSSFCGHFVPKKPEPTPMPTLRKPRKAKATVPRKNDKAIKPNAEGAVGAKALFIVNKRISAMALKVALGTSRPKFSDAATFEYYMHHHTKQGTLKHLRSSTVSLLRGRDSYQLIANIATKVQKVRSISRTSRGSTS